MKVIQAVALAVALLLVCCVTKRDRAVAAANIAADIATGAHEVIKDGYQTALDGCLRADDRQAAVACGDAVNARYAPAWKVYRALRAAWLVLAASIQSIDLLGEPIDDAELLAQMVALGTAVNDVKQALEAIP